MVKEIHVAKTKSHPYLGCTFTGGLAVLHEALATTSCKL